MEQTSKKAQPNQTVRRVKLFKTNKGWMTAGITTMALAAGAVTFAGTNSADAATWKARSVADIVDQIKTATTKSTYTIKWGDTLETIAQALEQTGIKTSADRLAEINHIAKADVIYAGNKLTFTGTGSTAVATVKQSDGTKKSYNLNPSKQAQASTKDVQEAKQSQQKVAAKATPVVQSKSTSAATTSTKQTDTSTTQATATTTTDSSAKFEQAVKDAGYTYTTTDDGQYAFELTNGSASDAAAIKQLASDNQVSNYQFTDNKLTALTADLQAIGAQVKSASGAYTFTAKTAAQYSAAKKLIAASGLSSKYSLTLVQLDATSTVATEANAQTDTTASDDATATNTATATATDTKSATTAASTTAAQTATTTATSTTPAKSTTTTAASTTPAKSTTTTVASTTPAKTTTTTAAKSTTSTTPAKTSTASKTSTAATTTTTTSSSSRTAKINAVIALAKKQLGKPYVWGAKGPSSFDCSGLMYYVFLNATGKNIGGYTVPQESAGTQVSVSNLQTGDLVFWGNHGNTYHVALYLGGGQYLEAPKPGYNVRISTLSSYFMPSFGVRVF
jgi:cell wall-associated NlpC family hydrolase